MTLTPGTRLGSHEIVAPIGAGGMGEVYKARDTKLGREVAIKVLPEAFAENKERLARFEREARLLASLNHPNIAAIHELEESDGVHFLVLEFVPGETLAEKIKQGPIPPVDEALALFKQIAEALEAAHEKGIIHRDLKPANIKVTPEGKAKVLDFGLAKALAGETVVRGLSESPTLTRDATETGVLLGTAPYMSPEQARGKAVDKRTDIWAFGCCLFEALTGMTAFLGDTVTDTIAKIVEREPDWEALPASTPASARSLLRRCLRKDLDRRVHDIADARIEIEEALTEPAESSPAPAVAGVERRRMDVLFIATAVVALMIGSVVVWSLMRSRAPEPRSVLRTIIPLPEGHQLALLRNTSSIAISPNSEYVAYVVQHGNSSQLYLRAMDQLQGRPIAGTESAQMPFFSPDSQWVGFLAGGKLKKVAVSGGALLTIGDVGTNIRGACWSSEGEIVFSPAGQGLSRVSAEEGALAVLTKPNRERDEYKHRLPDVLPGGNGVLFTLGSLDITSFNDASIAVLSLETGDYHVVLEGGTNALYCPPGYIVYARGDSLLAVPFDLANLRVTGTPVPVLQGVMTDPSYGSAQFGISRDGSLLYAPGSAWVDNRQVEWVDREGRSQPLFETLGAFYTPRLSPDGRLLALAIDGASEDVWLYDFTRGTMTRLTFGFDNTWPVWTPDRRRVAFSSWRPVSNIFWQAADGSGQAELLATSEYNKVAYSWSPDGENLAFVELHPQTGTDIWILSMEGDRKPEPFLRTEFNEGDPMFSPDGRWIAYASAESGQYEVYVQPFPGPGGKRQVSTGGGTIPIWNPDGKELFYRNGDDLMVVDVEMEGEPTLSKPQLLFKRHSVYGEYDVAPDGQHFVMVDEGELPSAPTQLILVKNWFEELKRLVPTEN